MRTAYQFMFLILVLVPRQLPAQNINKITGPLGLYHIAPGYTYNDTSGTDSLLLENEFQFGELCIPSQAADFGFDFVPELDSCAKWNANRIFGILQPITEQGVTNQPADTALYAPYPLPNGPGIIQGAQRFSRLSQLYGGYSGVILDDWNSDTTVAHQVHDAAQGKYVDENGNVCFTCPALTPYNKVFGVIYNTTAITDALPFIDGVSFWYHANQNCCYTNLDSDITQLRSNFPGKEILLGIYLENSALGWVDPASVKYMLAHAINRYDDGDINGVIIFAGIYLLKHNMPLSDWQGFALPYWLDSLYYPYLGAGKNIRLQNR